jgi:hypothetical protein
MGGIQHAFVTLVPSLQSRQRRLSPAWYSCVSQPEVLKTLMRTLPLLSLVALLLSCPFLIAQDQARLEVFGGYSLEHISACGSRGDAFLPCARFVSDGYASPANYNGWNASFTGFVYKFVGVSADFSGH